VVTLAGSGTAADGSLSTRAYVVRGEDRGLYFWRTAAGRSGSDWVSGTSPPYEHEGKQLFITWAKPQAVEPIRVITGPLAGDWTPVLCSGAAPRRPKRLNSE